MDGVKLWLKLLAMGYIFSTCLAENCNWTTQYEHGGLCCEACPQGEYPKQPCTATTKTVCAVCAAKHCACKIDEHLCTDKECSECQARPQCKPGEKLMRTGTFKYSYFCEQCPNQTYSNGIDSMCKPITDCQRIGLIAIFHGNRTHNAICGLPDRTTLQDGMTLTLTMICLCSITLICLLLLIIVHIQRTVARRKKNKHLSTACSLRSSDEYSCKLSTEEKGHDHNSRGFSDITSENCTLQFEI